VTISDAYFSAWLARDNVERVVLVEMDFAYESAGAPAEGILYFSDRPYVRAERRYRAQLQAMSRFQRSVNPDAIGGATQVAVSSLKLDNLDGSLDFMTDLIIDGREARFYLGDGEWQSGDFRLVGAALMEVIAGDEDFIEVLLRDHRLLLDKEIAGDVVTDERRKPLVFCCSNGVDTVTAQSVELVLKNATTLEYYALQNHAGAAITFLRDKGLAFGENLRFGVTNASLTANAGTDTLTLAGHGYIVDTVLAFGGSAIFPGLTIGTQYWVIAAGLTASDFRLSLTKGGAAVDITGTTFVGSVFITDKRYKDNVSVDGTLQLSADPEGLVTADVQGRSPSQSSLLVAPGEMLAAMLVDYGGISSSMVDAATFAAAGLATSLRSTARAVIARENLLEVLADIARVHQIFFGPDHEGVLHAFRLDLNALQSETPDWTLPASRVLQPIRVENDRVITGTVAINSQRNYRPLSFGEFADLVDVGTLDRSRQSGEFRETKTNTAPTGTAYSTNWQGFHTTARHVDVQGAFAQTGSDLTGVADEALGDLAPHIKRVHIETDLRAYEWRLGDVVQLTYPRYRFEDGWNFRVISVDPDFLEDIVRVTLLTRVTPDYTTSSYA
jgi:hypothetical protein